MLHRPRRSVLYMPGSRPRALDKARTLPADALILDLEDAVAPDEKPAARDLVAAAVAEGYGPREVLIRINGRGTPWFEDDLAMARAARPDGILVPKVDRAADLEGLAPGIPLWAMMETPRGILNAAGIAAAPGMGGLVMGTNDLVKELRAAHTPDRAPVAAALGLCLLAARAAGIACIDGVHNAIDDPDGLRAVCEAGRAMGFDGKTLIHPKQLEIANGVFAPSDAELAEARDMVAAFDAALARGEAVAVLNGRIVENLHVEEARRRLAEAEAIARLAEA